MRAGHRFCGGSWRMKCFLLCLALLPGYSWAQSPGSVSFAQTRIIVEEDIMSTQSFTPIQIPLVREGGTTGSVVVSIELMDPNNDFLSTTLVVTFADGSGQVSATAVIRNDNIPEGNETFTLTITAVSGGAQIGSLSSMELIIRASDEPHGLLQFDTNSLSSVVVEPTNAGDPGFTLTVLRGPGTIGTVTVEYQIVPSDPTFGFDDISPVRGQLMFAEGHTTENISLTITLDNIPEPTELFFVRLVNPGGGATLAGQNTQASITIQPNDAPISWSTPVTTVDEESGSVQLTIIRGLLPDGNMAGDLSLQSTVQVTTNSGSASSGSDFDPVSRTVTFSPGSSSLTVSIAIINDNLPEGDETFMVVLSAPSSDAVLSLPTTATVLIRINDNAGGLVFFASPGPVVVREDEQTTGRFIVRRTVGTFHNLTAEWQITSNQDGSVAISDFQPAQGNVTILDGVMDAFLDVMAFDDSIPEVSEGFTIELVRVVSEFGKLSDSGPQVASLIVADSDDVYGLLEWADDNLLSVAGTAPRELRLAINRSGDSIGIVSVDYNIIYLPLGTTDPSQVNLATALTFTGSVQLQGGQTLRDFSLTVPNSAFLETGGNFMATIDNATLIGGANLLIPPMSSPRIGARSQVLIEVSEIATSGFISFAQQSLQVSLSEPDNIPSSIDLNVIRSGSFGPATITWTISPSLNNRGATISDIGSNAGVVIIPNGANNATLQFTALPDDVPEVDEMFIVTLLQVTETNQMIRSEENEAVVTILANDDPSGIFSISNSTKGPFFLNEDNGILIITITRSHGDLTSELIRYDLIGEPGEIAGGQGLADFQPGVREYNVTLFVTNDDIPEVNETFLFTIVALNPNVQLGALTTVNVTILANDDYSGVFSFNDSSLTTSIVEPRSNDSIGPESTATLVVVREAGTFGTVDVTWEVTNPVMSTDLSENSGLVSFTEGQQVASFSLSAQADNDPENSEAFTVTLTTVSGDGRLASSSVMATLIILPNDDPIRFNRSFSSVQEGEVGTFHLVRGGQANGVAEVVFTLTYSSASPADVVVTPSDNRVTFAPGEVQASISVRVVDDTIPEEDELLTLNLVSVSGDAVLVSPSQATLAIGPSDDPNGVFFFSNNSLMVDTEEGETVDLIVVRGGGSFGLVSLRWTVYSFNANTSLRSIANTNDIIPTSGILNFSPREVSQTISLIILDDSIPELADIFEVELSPPTVEGVAVNGARLNIFSISVLTIGPSDEPYGVLRIADASTMIVIAEDVPPENTDLGRAQVQVHRTFGAIGNIRALWDVIPQAENNLPEYVDCIFFGQRGPGITTAAPRPNTATTALQFSGLTGSVVTVPSQYHPSNLSNGFTISVWLQPSLNANGILVAKTLDSGILYSLSLISDDSNFLLRFSYRQSANDQPPAIASAEVSLLKSDLTADGAWHSLVVTVGSGRTLFYRDNNFIDSRTLLSPDIRDEVGELTVGGLASSNFYTGTLQDVRIYLAPVTLPSQIQTLSTDPASLSLTPISGYISFPAGTATTSLTLNSIDDSIPEPSQNFVLSLSNVDGGARLSGSQDTAIITLLKSDSSNGVFGFDPDSIASVIDEPGMVTLSVNRSRGNFDGVTVTWEVREAVRGVVAIEDFDPATGYITFEDGEIQQSFTVTALDETVPELDEEFVVVLTSAVANDNETSSTSLSGASIDASRSQSALNITENDFPYGVMEFATSPPIPGEPIALATAMPSILVDESDGSVMVHVVRAQGTVGDVSIEYFTSDGTATDQGVEPDYISSAGQLNFPQGVTVQSFRVTLLDDPDPELSKTFYINLTNPRGTLGVPSLAIGQSLVVTIQPSDDAFGRFSFSANSLSFIVPEQSRGLPVTFTVKREGGRFGMVSVYWSVSQSLTNEEVVDISPPTGEVVFAEEESQQQFILTVNDDKIAELMEVFTVHLDNVTIGASIVSPSAATITVQANDHPYGRFVFSPVFRPLEGVVESGRVEVVITREFGSLGQVMVDFQTIPSQDIDTNLLLSGLQLNVHQLMNDSQLAITGEDYESTSGTLIFDNGDTANSFYINITADSIPEIDEYLFAVITRVELNQSSLTSVDSSVLPSVTPGNQSLAILVIAENDDARGVVQFSQTVITTMEPSQEFIILERSEGTFGSLTVQWEAVQNTADDADYSPTGGVVIIPPGVRMVPLPLHILEDNLPEFSEMFTVRLLNVSGGGILGAVSSASVTIEPSDDPNGAFVFAVGSRELLVDEPEDGNLQDVTLSVQRVGGTLGVVSVSWRITSSNGDASVDILPISGTLQFITASTQQSFVLSVLPDIIPELNEVFSVELVNATGGGNIGAFSVSNITVPSNDGPHGIVSFATPTAVTTEIGDNGTSIALLTVTRSIGFFGDIRVFFNVQSTDAATLALADGSSVLSYYTSPVEDLTLSSSALLQMLPDTSFLNDCGRACLSNEACLSFSYDVSNSNRCQLYLATQTPNNSVVMLGVNYYQKLLDRVLPFYQSVASDGNDFTPVVGQSVVISDGVMQSTIPVAIIGDSIPELNESLTITLTNVELINPVVTEEDGSVRGGPILGDTPQSVLVILENDDPRGRFVITGSDGSSVVRVVEPDGFTFGVTLRVLREEGSIGRVSVSWTVSGGTATQEDDFIGNGATLVFEEGEIQSTIALLILADSVPEIDETLTITLSNPTNGASIAPGDGGMTTVIIDANDAVAGVVSFTPLSRSAVVGEGESVMFNLVRTLSAMGVVEVDWEITGTGNASLEFISTRGTTQFLEGENTTVIIINVQSDATPELAERFTLTLLGVRTISDFIASGSGAATIDMQASTATITIRASNNPHGEVDFQDTSLSIRTEEGQSPELTIIRLFGTFGAIDVSYIAENGNMSSLGTDTNLASQGMDFISEVRTVRLEDGQQSAAISIHIIDDTAPELNEVFVVRLTSVSLVGGTGNTVPPSLGDSTAAEVTIVPNDSPQGEITFIQESYFVMEDVGSIDIQINREQGTVGQVSVVYFISNRGAMNEEDFLIEPLDDVVFFAGQSVFNLRIPILNDSDPEIEEEFCVGLRLPRGGAVLGNITTACVTILPNDDAYGVFSFNQDSLMTTLQETQGTATANNVAELRVERAEGLFGHVTIPYQVSAIDPEGAMLSDVSPERDALTFNPEDQFKIIQIEAVMDDIPELTEAFLVTLQEPIDFGRLSNNFTVARLEIAQNQDPFGVLQLTPVSSTPTVSDDVEVEETVGFVNYEVTRSFGRFGEVTVNVETTARTATSNDDGKTLSNAVSQAFNTSSASVWFSFVFNNSQRFLALGSQSQATLYAWRGVFTPIHTFSADWVTGFAWFSPAEGEGVLVVANGGTQGNREIFSQVYRFTASEELTLIQDLPTVGVKDVVSFQSSMLEWYVVVANGQDNAANPNVDSILYRWNGTGLEQTQNLATIGASALEIFTIDGTLYMAVTSLTDTRSQVFIWNRDQFRLDHTFDTQQATDVTFMSTGPYLLVVSETVGLTILTRSEAGRFTANVTIQQSGATRVERIGDENEVSFVIANRQAPSQVYVFEESTPIPTEVISVSFPLAQHIYSFILPSGASFLAAAGVLLNSEEYSIIYELRLIDTSITDFYSRNLTLIFAPGESTLTFSVGIVDDNFPEVDEEFTVDLRNPMGGARLGQQTSITMILLTNDDAHGVFGFANESRSVIISEMESDFVVSLDVERNAGTFGLVIVDWQLSGHHMTGEITPASGQVTFQDGVSVGTIVLSIQSDNIAELNEVTTVTLTSIVENGVPMTGDQSRGARLMAGQTEAVITVQANDDPHGVVGWSPTIVMVEEQEGSNNVVQLTLVREFGVIGAIVVSYTTELASNLSDTQQAEPLMDFVPTSGEVVIGNGESSGTISVTILQDNIPELNESFIVNITNVRIADEADRQGSTSNSPRVSEVGQTLQVIIGENDDNRGLLSFSTTAVSVEEIFDSQVVLQIIRTRGTFGSVSVEYVITEETATSMDYNIPTMGILEFKSGQESVNLTIDIVNDRVPEGNEIFNVALRNGMGGAEISTPSSIAVTILSNDDINGVFFYANNSLLVVIAEAVMASLTVERGVSAVGESTVYWEVSSNGLQDLEPVSGNLTFQENVTQQTFTVRAVPDGLPEAFEAFPIRLVSIDGGGRLVDPRESFIAIQASDDPAGVLGLQQFPDGVVVSEGEEIVVGVIRDAGTSGTVTLTWDIVPPDTTVFATTSDTVVLVDGQTDASITIQTLSDQNPEIRRSFSLQILSASLARIDLNATSVEIIIRASNNPHGTVMLSSSIPITTSEGAVPIQLNIIRLDGLIGDLLVNFTTVPSSADQMDFSISESSVTIPSEMSTATLTIDIVDDTIPELDEIFSILLTSVELTDSVEDTTVPPTLGANTMVQITILASDNPFGSISLAQERYSVAEGNTIAISLVRVGGTLGVSTVTYATVNGRAQSPQDYTDSSGTVVFAQGQVIADVHVSTIDDVEPEVVEDFGFVLLEVNVGSLGNITMATILIEASDSPFGAVGFSLTDVNSGVSIANPTQSPASVSLLITRVGGTIGSTDITWNVTGPGSSGLPSADISPSSIRGVLTMTDGQSSGQIVIIVLPTATDEPEETFTVSLTSITNNVLIDSTRSRVVITVGQNGSPFGIISFLGDAISTQRVMEGDDAVIFSLPLVRDGDLSGAVSVSFVVSRVDNDGAEPVSLDVTPTSGTVLFPVLQGRISIDLTILPDDIAESDELYQVTLLQPTGGASINPQASIATFIISNNGNRFGVFGVVNATVSASTVGGSTSRALTYTIVRRRGQVVGTDIIIRHSYNQDLAIEVVPATISRSLPVSSSELEVTLPISQDTFLHPGSIITVAITNVTVTSPAQDAGMTADISTTDGTVQVIVSDDVANIVVGFSSQSLNATVNETSSENNVMLTVFRRGELGNADVSWTTTASTVPGFAPGSLVPVAGTLQFSSGENTTTFSLTARPASPHGRAEIFEVSLLVVSLDQSFPSQVDSRFESAFIEPMGVLQLANIIFSSIEGSNVTIPVWRRFGSMGSVVVTGVASSVVAGDLPANVVPATPMTDFSSVPISLTLSEGMTTAFFNIYLSDNSLQSSLKVFQFSLTSVRPSANTASMFQSPRLSSVNTTATVTIIDDERGAGQFQISPTTATTAEGSTLTFTLVRSGGTSGRVSVLLQTLDSGLATSEADYQPINVELVFESGISQLQMSINIIDDVIPETAEDFSIILSTPSGGVALIDPNANVLRVTIQPSDNPAGVISFITASLALSEDGPTSGELEVRRSNGLSGMVVVSWVAHSEAVDVSRILVNAGGTITFDDNSATPNTNIVLQLKADGVIPSTGEQFTVRLNSDTEGVGLGVPIESRITVQPRIIGMFHIIQTNLTSIVTSPQEVSIRIERSVGLQIPVQVNYNTSQPRQPVTIGMFTFQPALPLVHFSQIDTSVTFNPGDSSKIINVPVISVGSTPVAFFIQIGSNLHQVVNGTAVVVVSPPGPNSSLYSIYFEALSISTSQELDKVSSDLLTTLAGGLINGNNSNLIRFIIEELIEKTLPPVDIDYTNTSYVSNMLDIFQQLLSDRSYTGQSFFIESMKSFAYSLLEDSLCDGPVFAFSRPLYYLEAAKLTLPSLIGKRYASINNSDYVQFPAQIINTQLNCLNVHFIEFFTERLFLPPTFQSKVLSVGIQEIPLLRFTDPIVYQIHSDQNLGLLPLQDHCLLWNGADSVWDTSVCSPQTDLVLQENYIHCECSQLGDMAASADVYIGYGWTFPAGVSAAITIIAVLLVMIIHFRYLPRTRLVTRILICLCFSIFAHQLILLVDIFASDAEGVSADGCAALGALLQLTAVAQFVWIAAMAMALWVNFIGLTSGDEPLVLYIIISWGISILVVAVTLLVGRFVVGFELNTIDGLYGPVRDLCFMPHVSASLLSIVLPVVLSLLAMVALMSHTCIYWSRWEDFKSFYHDSFNRTEIPLLLVFFTLIFLSSLAAYLHAYVGLVYTFGAFVFFNTIQGLYAVTVYFFASWHTLTRKHDKYNVGDDVEPLAAPALDDDDPYFGSLSLSTYENSLNEKDKYSENSFDLSSPGTGVVPIGMRPLHSSSDLSPKYTPVGEESKEDSHMDDLLFMLKTQNFSGESVASDESDRNIHRSRHNRLGMGAEHFERRRISIADTHL